MKLLLSSLLLASLRARSSWCVSSTGTLVTQSPDVSVMEGDTVNITCCWTGATRLRVTWLKSETDNTTGNFSYVNFNMQTFNCSYLTFMNVTTEDSGRYICKVSVEIPILDKVEGKGTVITVTDRSNTKDDTAGDSHGSVEEVFITVLRYLCILALVVTVFCINKLTSKSQQHTPAAPRNELTSAKRTNEEEEARDEREMETE